MPLRLLIGWTVSAAALVSVSRVGDFLPPDGELSVPVWVVMCTLLVGAAFVIANWVVASGVGLRAAALRLSAAVGSVASMLAVAVTYWALMYAVFSIAGDAEPAPAWTSSAWLGVSIVALLAAEVVILAVVVARGYAAKSV